MRVRNYLSIILVARQLVAKFCNRLTLTRCKPQVKTQSGKGARAPRALLFLVHSPKKAMQDSTLIAL
jgi:hypothetical protein